MACSSPVGPSVPAQLVEQGWATWSGFAQRILGEALATNRELVELEIPGTGLPDVNLNVTVAPPSPMANLKKPTAVETEFAVDTPPVRISLNPVDLSGFPSLPSFSGVAPTFDYPATPGEFLEQAPTEPSNLPERLVPDLPSYALPAVPSMRQLVLPDVPQVTLTAFTEQAPESTGISPPLDAFTYTDTPFSSELLDELQAKIREWLQGGTGIPANIWQDMWERARGKERLAARAARQQVMEEWAAKGFFLPTGIANAGLLQVTEKTRDMEATLSRDMAIKEAEMEQSNIRFAMEKGIALVSFLGELHNQTMQRAFAVAQFAYQAQINIFNVRVDFYKAQLAGYQAKASVWKEQLQAELVKLEIYKNQLEGQKLIGQLNLQDVEVYKARLQGVLAVVDLYKAQVEGVKTQVEADALKIQTYKAKVEAFGERVKAYLAQVEVYAKQLDAQKTRASIFQVEGEVFASQARAYAANVDGVAKQKQVTIEANNVLLKQFEAETDAWKAKVLAEAERVKALLGAYEADARVYETDGRVAGLKVTSDVERYRLALEQAKAQVQNNIEKAKLEIEQIMRISQLEVEAQRQASQSYAQLEAAALSAVQLSAGATSQDQTQWSYDYQC